MLLWLSWRPGYVDQAGLKLTEIHLPHLRAGSKDVCHHTQLEMLKIILLYAVAVRPAWVSVYQVCARCPQKPEEDIGSLGLGVTDSSELPCGC